MSLHKTYSPPAMLRHKTLSKQMNVASQFPSSYIKSVRSRPVKSSRRRRTSHKIGNSPNIITENPKRKGLRIKNSVNESIKSHVNRLADYRYRSMAKSADACCSDGTCPYGSSTAVPSSHRNHDYSRYTVGPSQVILPRMPKRTTVVSKIRRKQKRAKEKELWVTDLLTSEEELLTLDNDIKRITESVQHFERQRLEFLNSLANVHAQISSFHIATPTLLKQEAENEEMKGVEKKLKQEMKHEMSNTHSMPKISPIMRSLGMAQAKGRVKKSNPSTAKSPNMLNLKSDIMDNLSQLLLKAGLPGSKSNHKQKLDMSRFPISTGNLPVQSGLMNLAQTFCSMATGV